MGGSSGAADGVAEDAYDKTRSFPGLCPLIGTPNFGSYAPVQVFDLSHGMPGPLGLADQTHDRKTLAGKYLRAFPGLIEMMPQPDKRPDFAATLAPRHSGSGGAVPPTVTALRAAKQSSADLPQPDDRFHQIIGTGEDTVVGASKGASGYIYHRSMGWRCVHRAPAIWRKWATRVAILLQLEGKHGWLCNRSDVIAGTIDLIGTGATHALDTAPRLRAIETVMADVDHG